MDERRGSTKSSKEAAENQEKWVYDSSVDHKGNVPLRASTGVWKASLFIVGKELKQSGYFLVLLLVAEKAS